MGNHVSKKVDNWPQHKQLEYGSLLPQGIYPCSSCDYDVKAVRKFIKEGLLAPFFIGLNEPMINDNNNTQFPPSPPLSPTLRPNKKRKKTLFYTPNTMDQQNQINILLYSETIECPICFLTYPNCINYTRCCFKPICTDCFLQLRRSLDLPLTSVSCPFCNQPNLGVIHLPPTWSKLFQELQYKRDDLLQYLNQKGRKKKIGPNDPNVILVDQVRPNWQDQLYLSKNYRRYSGNLSGSGTTRRIIVRPAMTPTVTSSTL